MSALRVRAPATTANLGPGFDCAGAALDLWNELEVSDGDGVVVHGEGVDEIEAGPGHLGLRAFALVAPVEGRRFAFTNRIPLARGLGSSASTIALGLVAGAICAGRWPDPEELLAIGLELEGHADNLAAALAGGVCLTWVDRAGRPRLRRVASSLPLVPIAVVPSTHVSTKAARASLPELLPHGDATFTVSRATLLGAALATGAADLLAEAFDDRLHEPYRGPLSTVFGPLREEPPAGAAGVTVSGSGPTVIVWARPDEAEGCEAGIRARGLEAAVLRLDVAPRGAGPIEDVRP
ncbi:MAG: homoserine kinase [Thermoleophilia bacterium]